MQTIAQDRGRSRRTWGQVVSSIWDTSLGLSMESTTLPRGEAAGELCNAVCDRDHPSCLSLLASRPELALYQRVYGEPEFRQYLQRGTQGQQAARVRFQLRSGTFMLRKHDNRLRDQPRHDTEDRICPACGEPKGRVHIASPFALPYI